MVDECISCPPMVPSPSQVFGSNKAQSFSVPTKSLGCNALESVLFGHSQRLGTRSYINCLVVHIMPETIVAIS